MFSALSNVSVKLSKTNETIIKVAAIVGAITVIAGGYSFYLNNFWRPKIEVVLVDFAKGNAVVKISGILIPIYGDATFSVGGDWGVKLGSNTVDDKIVYDRLELTKKGMVVEYLKK